ncbi:hypothetical protein [Nocardia vinacea]|uniref:hypothetical protein n=1 Tax=Nocardia vinacea TaxID=96468 RepID=UPI00031F5AB5|nr:hypothetical protein [Nocardia vinacea]
MLFDELGLPRPEYVTTKDQLGELDSAFDSRLGFYGSYLSGAELFRQTTYDRALHFEFDDMTLLRYIRWHLRHIGDTGQVDGDIATAV